ncbi:E3 ubiquitin--protein ligase [Erwinia amylovora]|uniref:E3 ubiquitin--protein ligase n=1 Tax=Erwinia amylovora TaxID=552 RepID=UPI001443C7DB|nr:E3 ubiquitin--protein ligase [Erwinia amylovora]
MKLWNKTLLASAICLLISGCDDASKVDANLDKAKDNAAQIKDAAADKASALEKDVDKHIDAIKQEASTQAQQLTDKAKAIKAEADSKAASLSDEARNKAEAIKADAKQQSDRIVEQAGQIKDNAIAGANTLASDAAGQAKEIKDSIQPKQADSPQHQ